MRIPGTARGLSIVTLLAGVLAYPACAQTLDELKNDGRNTDNVLTYGMGYHQNRYSTLKQINKSNVKRLVPVWSVSMNSSYGEQAQPLVYNGVMYVTDAEATVAIDIGTGKQLWRTPGRLGPGDPARGLLRRVQQGPGALQRQGVPRDARRARRRARSEDRQADLEAEGDRVEGWLIP